MIQPVSAFSPQAGFRGSGEINSKKKTQSKTSTSAMINAGSVAVAVGGLTTAVARSYTPSWSQASVLGFCAMILSMFFMTPQLLQKLFADRKNVNCTTAIKSDANKMAGVVKEMKPAMKMLPFKQS